MSTSLSKTLLSQWMNPEDIFSLLLLVGGETIRQTIARLVGVRFKQIHLTPVAFSFGWVAYAFMSLAAVAGECRLMPEADTKIQVINIDDGYVRENSSWVLGRLIRDHESRVREVEEQDKPIKDSTGKVSLLIDIFIAESSDESGPPVSKIWKICWGLILVQLIISAIPCFTDKDHRDWSILLITGCGTVLGLLTAGLPQWAAEKWPAERLKSEKMKAVALTRGNGHQYVMVILGHQGAWDLEAMSSSRLHIRWETRPLLVFLAGLWIVLLITVTGLKENKWYLLAVGIIGMIQNIVVGAKSCSSEQFDIHLRSFNRPTITGFQYDRDAKQKLRAGPWKEYKEANAETDFSSPVEEGKVRDVMGALMELEKCYPKAGIALVPIFFPGSIDYRTTAFGNDRERLFWQHAESKKKQERNVAKKSGEPSNTIDTRYEQYRSDDLELHLEQVFTNRQGWQDRYGDRGSKEAEEVEMEDIGETGQIVKAGETGETGLTGEDGEAREVGEISDREEYGNNAL